MKFPWQYAKGVFMCWSSGRLLPAPLHPARVSYIGSLPPRGPARDFCWNYRASSGSCWVPSNYRGLTFRFYTVLSLPNSGMIQVPVTIPPTSTSTATPTSASPPASATAPATVPATVSAPALATAPTVLGGIATAAEGLLFFDEIPGS